MSQKKSKTEFDGEIYKKEWINNKGDLIKTEYQKKPNTQSINEQLSNEMEDTVKKWTDESETVLTDDFEDKLKPFIGRFVRYQARQHKGKDKGKIVLRVGGFVTKVENKYMYLTCNIGGWSVQYDNLIKVFVKKQKEKKEKKEKTPKELKKIQKKVRQEIEERKEEEGEDEQQEQKEQDDEPLPPPPPRRLSDVEADEILKKAYYDDDMKFGRDKLYATLKADGKNVTRKQVDNWLKKQVLYQLDKPAFEPKEFVVQQAHAPNNVWNIDLVEMDGDKIVLNCVDRFSKYAYSRILRNKTAKQVINALKSIFRNVKPRLIVSDNGVEFKAVITQEFLKSQDVKQIFSTPHNPASNGLVERFNRTMKDMFKKMTFQKTARKVTFTQPILNRILKAYNNSHHSIIDMKPIDALKEENAQKVKTMNEKHLSVGNKIVQKDDVEKGDQVRISLNKGNDKKTKQYRTNWSEDLFFIAKVIRGNGLKPIQYKVENQEGRKVKGVFKREEIQPIKYTENQDMVDVPYEISRFVKEVGDEIEVSYKGYRQEDNRYIEKSLLKRDLGNSIYKKLYDEMKK
ncbi:MAG: transposase family protein [Mesoflavibacter sp.]|nr:transposase family protein [Mesoflavibacter sp.]